MKALLVVLDGLGDRPAGELGGRTPLQAARTPNLDRLASMGSVGLFYSLRPGECPGTDLAHFVMLGYERGEYPGRGLAEALGEGFDVGDEQVVGRASFVCVAPRDGALIIKGRAKDLTDPEGEALGRALAPGFDTALARVDYHFTGQRQAIFIISPKKPGLILSPEVTDADPFADDLPVISSEPLAGAREAAGALTVAEALEGLLRTAYRVLDTHPVNKKRRASGQEPANMIVTKMAAKRRPLEPFAERYGMKATAVASGAMLRGLMTMLGVEFREVRDAGATKELEARLEAAGAALAEGYDFVFVHSKRPDDAAHSHDPTGKKQVIEELDKALAKLIPLPDDTLVVITADHSTPSTGKLIHSGEPVPMIMAGPTVRCDGVDTFDEVACAQGALGQIRGEDLMLHILNLTDRASFSGCRRTPAAKAFAVTAVRPLEI